MATSKSEHDQTSFSASLMERLGDLERRLAEQDAEIRRLRAVVDDGHDVSGVGAAPETTDRRGFVRTVASTAAGALIGGATAIAASKPTAAANGDPVILGSVLNTGTQATGIAVSGTAADYGFGITDNGLNGLNGFPAVFGHAKGQNFFVGVLGVSEGTSPATRGDATDGFGVVGNSINAAGVRGNSISDVGGRFSGGRAGLRLEPGVLGSPPTRSDLHAAGEIDFDASSSLWCCVQGGSPGTWRTLAGAATAGSLHVLASTVRVYDSRVGFEPGGVVKGALGTDEERVIDCGLGGSVPAGATAVFANVTIVSASSAGFLAAFKNGIDWPGNSTVNWDRLGQVVANSAVIALDASATFKVRSRNPVDFLVDVIGYYR